MPMSGADAQAESAVTDVFREQAGRVTAALIRRFRDFDLAEESVQDALVAALETWPSEGVPERPTAWLTTVATRRALNRLDRDRRYREKLAEVAVPPRDDQDDDRLRLILTCCHPALSREAQVGLTLRAVVGFTTSEIARAFVAPEATIAQRLFRAKRKVAAAGIPYRIPSDRAGPGDHPLGQHQGLQPELLRPGPSHIGNPDPGGSTFRPATAEIGLTNY
jgi:RNA polymerase sigma factor (sigma-70 family)